MLPGSGCESGTDVWKVDNLSRAMEKAFSALQGLFPVQGSPGLPQKTDSPNVPVEGFNRQIDLEE